MALYLNQTLIPSIVIKSQKDAILHDSKTVTPSTKSITVTPDSGYDGMSTVIVNAIPSQYKDTSSTNAVAADVMSGKTFANASGIVTGSFTIDDELTEQADLLAQIQSAIAEKSN